MTENREIRITFVDNIYTNLVLYGYSVYQALETAVDILPFDLSEFGWDLYFSKEK